jgi:diaminohydroxyphosphoribosylaminopyrimidine deaminase/5-amino-6-(5-phosphoribosylamino)uracil reductase
VLVNQGQIVGEGWHQLAGEPHAEIIALHQAGEAAQGATAYVTLEPCIHHGKTPPCADALVDARVARVVSAMQDPNPLVAGRALQRLQQVGIATETGVLEKEARELNPGFIKRMANKIPLLRCKMAMSLDGRTAMESGESQWITGLAARADVQRWRARSDAVITGIGTVLDDNPSLTVRPGEFELPELAAMGDRQPLRVVLDSKLRIPLDASLFGQPGNNVIVCSTADEERQDEVARAGATVWCLPNSDGQVDLPALMYKLAEIQCNEVLLECGASLAGRFLQSRLLDELIIYMAPILMGSEARPLFDLPLAAMAKKLEIQITDICAVGNDWRIMAVPLEK